MAFCKNCGTELPEGTAFCPSCGAPQNEAPAAPAQSPANPDTDATANKWMAALSYLGPLVFIPMFTKKDSPFVQFHAKQGLLLFSCEVIAYILTLLLGLFKVTRYSVWLGEYQASPWWVTLISSLLSLAVFVLFVFGVVYALGCKKKKLPVIGEITVYDKFFQ